MAKKLLKPLTDADIVACQPEAIWLEKKKSPLPSHSVFWILILALIGAVIWACLSTVDEVVVAEGKLTTVRPNIVLKPLERTVIKEINVRTGQEVHEGEVLISFDPTLNHAEFARLTEQRESLMCQKIRLEAEADKKPFILPDDLKTSSFAKLQVYIYNSNSEYIKQKIFYFDENIQRFKKVISSLEISLNKYNERLQSMENIEELYVNLKEKGVVPVKDVFDVQISRIGMEIEAEKQRSSLIDYQQQELSAIAEKQAFLLDYHKSLMEELVKVERDVISLNQEIEKFKLLDQMIALKSPCRAIVHEIAPFQEGSAVREAEPLVTLIPLDEELEAEVDVDPSDIGQLSIGVPAKIKMDAFPFQKHGTMMGKIRYISYDAFDNNQAGQASDQSHNNIKSSRYRFIVRLTLSGSLQHVPEDFHQTAGMRLRCEMKVGERSIISYLIHPLIKALDESMKEPR